MSGRTLLHGLSYLVVMASSSMVLMSNKIGTVSYTAAEVSKLTFEEFSAVAYDSCHILVAVFVNL